MIHIKNVENSDFENPIDIIVVKTPLSIRIEDFKKQAGELDIELSTDRVTVVDNLFLTGPSSKARFNVLYPNGTSVPGMLVLYNTGIGDLNNRVIEELLENYWDFTMFESNLTRHEKSKYIELYEQKLKNVDRAARFPNHPFQPSSHINSEVSHGYDMPIVAMHIKTEISHGFDSPIVEWYETYEVSTISTFVVHSYSAPYNSRLDDITPWKLKQIPREKVFHEEFRFDTLNEAHTHLIRMSKGKLEPAISDDTPFVLLKR